MKSPFRVEVRRATPADADAIALVHTWGWRETYSHLVPERFYGAEALEGRRTSWARLLGGNSVSEGLRVATLDGGPVVGVALSGPARGDEPARDLELFLLYTTAAHYGTGIGQALLDAVLGDRPAQLWVADDNLRARAFYRRNGFAPDGVEKIDAALEGLREVRLVR